jgi:hypothetical protein
MTTQTYISDEDGDPKTIQYWTALGRFVELFSLTELAVQLTLRRSTKVTATVAAVLFSGTRVDAATSQIKRIAEAEPWQEDQRQKLDTLCAQLGEITRTRNDLLHYGAFDDGDSYLISNALSAHVPSKLRETKIDANTLDAMSMDLLVIVNEFDRIARRKPVKRHPDLDQLKMPPERAWLYKPDTQQGPPKRTLGRNRKPKAQPPTSRG